MPIDYFNKYLFKQLFDPRIFCLPTPGTTLSIVIPCFNEPDILTTLESLKNCEQPLSPAEVIVVLNYPEDSSPEITEAHYNEVYTLEKWSKRNSSDLLQFHTLTAPPLPKKFAGVGLARKIGMDEAVFRFSQFQNNPNGIICGFDADSTVEPNYFREVEKHFKNHPKSPGASIYFEHPLDSIHDLKLKSGIIQYEAHLRYLLQATRYTGFPYAFHTVGSSFAVRANAYVKQGGMNRFKAGEDFYFINKIIPLGGYTEINSTRVNPQARVSNRVPFGTGASMKKWMEADEPDFLTYQFASFQPLKRLFNNLESIYAEKTIKEEMVNNKVLWQFLLNNDFAKAVEECFTNSSNFSTFTKRFYTWFDAFKIVKYLNYAALNSYPKLPVLSETNKLINQLGSREEFRSTMEMLEFFRNWDRSGKA